MNDKSDKINDKIKTQEKKKRTLKGVIVSLKMQKTAVVKVDRLKFNPKYKMRFKKSKKFKAHVDREGYYKVGDEVIIEETRPLSREKRWKVKSLVHRAQ